VTEPPNHPAGALYQTDLATTPLPEILVTIHRYKVPGTIECRRGDDVKRVFLDRGQIIFATSSRVEDSLGDKLLREGKISRDQYEESGRRIRQTGKRQGVALIEMHALQPKDLFVALREQIQEIVWSLFAWQDGTVIFTPGRDKHLEFIKIEIPIPQAILQGVRRMPDARALVARLGTKATLLERTTNSADFSLAEDEGALLEQIDGRTPLVDLINTPPLTPADNARVLYAFLALQLIAVRQPVKVQIKTEAGKHGR
jgi:two-component system OmpR family response regulator